MALFKKLKKDIGVKDEADKKEAEEENVEEEEEEAAENSQKQDWLESEGQLTVDVFQEGSKFVVEAPIAGVNPEDIEVFVEEGMLVIKGTRQRSFTEKSRKYFYQECYWGGFSREIMLPDDVDSSKIQARFKNGVLTIEMPKTGAKSRKRIIIKTS